VKRNTRRFCSFVLATALTFTTVLYSDTYDTKAETLIYDDSNLSLTAAFDRYIATGTGELAQQLQLVVSEELAVETMATATDADLTQTGTITEVDLASTGTIVEIATEQPEETTEELSEEAQEAIENAGENQIDESTAQEASEDVAETTTETTADYSAFSGKAIITATGVVNIRSDATASSDKVGTITTGGVVNVESKGSDWSVISSGNVRGYIKNEFMAFDDAAGKYADEHSNLVAYDSAVAYTAPVVTTEVSTDTEYQPATEAVVADVITTSTSGYQDVVDYALQFVGNPYVYGGSSLTNGTDCSGFTMSVYANFGYSLPHSSAMQATKGTEVDLSAVSPGDLVFYKNGGTTIGHVALYIGNGQVVHASTSKTGIIVSNMYYSTPCKAVRIVN
jgi:cell wall-associated NlpC family hydrolase